MSCCALPNVITKYHEKQYIDCLLSLIEQAVDSLEKMADFLYFFSVLEKIIE